MYMAGAKRNTLTRIQYIFTNTLSQTPDTTHTQWCKHKLKTPLVVCSNILTGYCFFICHHLHQQNCHAMLMIKRPVGWCGATDPECKRTKAHEFKRTVLHCKTNYPLNVSLIHISVNWIIHPGNLKITQSVPLLTRNYRTKRTQQLNTVVWYKSWAECFSFVGWSSSYCNNVCCWGVGLMTNPDMHYNTI